MSCASVLRYGLDAPAYVDLLRAYLARRFRLDASMPENGALIDAAIAAADRRFAYVSFLAERFEQGLIDVKSLRALAESAPEGERGAALYRSWLTHLDLEHGAKRAEALRQVLCTLAAAEEAHAWVFGEGRKIDPATGAALTPLNETFEGLEIGTLAALLHLDRPQAREAYDRIDPDLHLSLQTLQGVLWVSRAGLGTTRFRLALKAFLPVAQELLGPQLKLRHARLVHHVMDAAEVVRDGADETGRARVLLQALAPLAEASVALSGSETAARRWDVATPINVLGRIEGELQEGGFYRSRIALLTLMAALHTSQNNDKLLAASLIGRGNAKQGGGNLKGAIADYDQAVRLLRLHSRSASEASPVIAVLVRTLLIRGTVKASAGELSGAMVDFDAAFAEIKPLVHSHDMRFVLQARDLMADVMENRGTVSAELGNFEEAIRSHSHAIDLHEEQRRCLGDQWTVAQQDALARALHNRGVARKNAEDHPGAISDFAAAADLLQTCGAPFRYGPSGRGQPRLPSNWLSHCEAPASQNRRPATPMAPLRILTPR